MKVLKILASAVALLVVATNCMAGMSTRGQTIVGHEVFTPLSSAPNSWVEVRFITSKRVPGGKKEVLLYMPSMVLNKETDTATVFWHGDNGNGVFVKNPRRAIGNALRLGFGMDVVVVVRPHSVHKRYWRQKSEIRLHIAVIEYLAKTFEVKLNLLGHSGGAIVAIAMAQERPQLVGMVGLAAPKLAVLNHYRRHEGGVPDRARTQYDPIRYIDQLPNRMPILVVYGLDDTIVRRGGVLPYIKEAEEIGLNLKWVRSQGGHYNIRRLGLELRKEENKEFWPR